MDLMDKILEGYFYRPSPAEDPKTGRVFHVSTGSGGARNLIQAGRDMGFPDEAMQHTIEVFFDRKWHKLSDVTINENKYER